jgi:hypothetical protein
VDEAVRASLADSAFADAALTEAPFEEEPDAAEAPAVEAPAIEPEPAPVPEPEPAPVPEPAPEEAPATPATPLSGNKAVEEAAIRWVMQLERAAGRQPVDRRYDAKFPADIESPPRIIEVKAIGTSTRGWFLPLEVKQFDKAQQAPNFYIYVVENTRQGDPTEFTLKILGGKRLHQLLARARERRYYELPWPVAHYDGTPGMEALSEPKP